MSVTKFGYLLYFSREKSKLSGISRGLIRPRPEFDLYSAFFLWKFLKIFAPQVNHSSYRLEKHCGFFKDFFDEFYLVHTRLFGRGWTMAQKRYMKKKFHRTL